MLLRLVTALPLIIFAAAMIGEPDRLVQLVERASTGLTSMRLDPAGAWYVRCCGILLASAVALMVAR